MHSPASSTHAVLHAEMVPSGLVYRVQWLSFHLQVCLRYESGEDSLLLLGK